MTQNTNKTKLELTIVLVIGLLTIILLIILLGLIYNDREKESFNMKEPKEQDSIVIANESLGYDAIVYQPNESENTFIFEFYEGCYEITCPCVNRSNSIMCTTYCIKCGGKNGTKYY